MFVLMKYLTMHQILDKATSYLLLIFVFIEYLAADICIDEVPQYALDFRYGNKLSAADVRIDEVPQYALDFRYGNKLSADLDTATSYLLLIFVLMKYLKMLYLDFETVNYKVGKVLL